MKKCIALLSAMILCLAFASCSSTGDKTENEKAVTNSAPAAVGKESAKELVVSVIQCIKNKGDFSEIADCFDKNLTTAYCLAVDIPYSDLFEQYYCIAEDFDKGADYITETYPEFAEAFEKAAGKPLTELYDETLDRCQRTYDSIEANFNEIKNGNELLWDNYENAFVFDEEAGIQKYSVQVDYDYDRDGDNAIVGANLYYVERKGKFYGLFLNTTIGGGKGA